MSPADQPQAIGRRSTDPPTLWLSLALGSVLIHLVAFILISVVLTRTAKVQLDLEPIVVEFVEPDTNPVQGQSAAASRAIAVRPGKPSASILSTNAQRSNAQRQPHVPRSQPFALNQPVEQPFTPQSVKRRQPPVRPQILQPNSLRSPVPQQPNAPSQRQSTPLPRQPSLPNLSQTQPIPGTNSPSGDLTGSGSGPMPQPTETQKPVESGQSIAQLPQGRSVLVSVSTAPNQVIFDRQQQPAKPIEQQKTVSLDYPDAIAQISSRSLRIEVTLRISDKGLVVDPGKPKLLSPEDARITQSDLDYIARQIFETWQFEPAQDASGLKPAESNLIIDAQIQFP